MFELLGKIRDIIVGGFEAIGTFFTWVGELLSDVVDVFVKATQAMRNASVWLVHMIPTPALAVFTAILTVAVIYKFLGREG